MNRRAYAFNVILALLLTVNASLISAPKKTAHTRSLIQKTQLSPIRDNGFQHEARPLSPYIHRISPHSDSPHSSSLSPNPLDQDIAGLNFKTALITGDIAQIADNLNILLLNRITLNEVLNLSLDIALEQARILTTEHNRHLEGSIPDLIKTAYCDHLQKAISIIITTLSKKCSLLKFLTQDLYVPLQLNETCTHPILNFIIEIQHLASSSNPIKKQYDGILNALYNGKSGLLDQLCQEKKTNGMKINCNTEAYSIIQKLHNYFEARQEMWNDEQNRQHHVDLDFTDKVLDFMDQKIGSDVFMHQHNFMAIKNN